MNSHISPARPPVFLKLLLVIAAVLGFATAPMVTIAQDTSSSSEAPAASSSEEPLTPVLPTPDTVVATVNGQAITEAELSFMQEDLAAQLSQVPPELLRAVLLAQVINIKLLAGAGDAAGLDDADTFKRRVKYMTDRALSRSFAQTEIASAVTPEAIQAAYDKTYGTGPSDELHVLHVLVSTEEDAKAIKASLDAGADFTTLAKEKSIDPSAAQNGGDLGYVQAWAQLVKPFLDAAMVLKDGEVSAPVQSQFGWHIIKVVDRRPATKPDPASVRNELAQQVYADAYQAAFAALKGASTIDIPDPALKAQVDMQLAP